MFHLPRNHAWDASPPVNADKQENPYDVYKVPVPGSELKSQMFILCERARVTTAQTNGQKYGADYYVQAVEARRKEEG